MKRERGRKTITPDEISRLLFPDESEGEMWLVLFVAKISPKARTGVARLAYRAYQLGRLHERQGVRILKKGTT